VSPEEVEENLTKTIENAAASASRVEKITSTSSEGSAFVIVEYQWGTDLADASNDLRERLDLIRDFIPEEATQPVLFKFDPSMMPIMILSVEGRRDPASLRYIAEHGQDQPGADRRGGQRRGGRRVQRQINGGPEPALLASYGLTIDRVVGLLRSREPERDRRLRWSGPGTPCARWSSSAPGGDPWGGGGRLGRPDHPPGGHRRRIHRRGGR
jgi:HAE1 family hydrophobic/amphiphilic exporter-1